MTIFFDAVDPSAAVLVNLPELLDTNKALYKRNNDLLKAIKQHRKMVQKLKVGVTCTYDSTLWKVLDKHLNDYR